MATRGRKRQPRKLETMVLATPEVAEILMLSRSRVEMLVKEGWIKRKGRNEYIATEAVQGYINFLRNERKANTMNAADSRVRDARAKDIEARTAQRLGRLVSIEVYDEMIDGFAGVVRSELAGMPAACTRDLTMRRIIERELNARLKRMAEHALAQAIRLETLGEPDSSVGPNGAGRMGRSKSDVPSDGGSSGAA